MKTIGIIGGGFTGTMTAVQVIEKANTPCEITIFNEPASFNKGVAFTAYSTKHLLNVIAGKMSAYTNKPNHFLDWLLNCNEFKNNDRQLISNSFVPRQFYGNYLADIWKQALVIAAAKNIRVNVIESLVTELDVTPKGVSLSLANGSKSNFDKCVIATGNNISGNPAIKNNSFYSSKNYFQNPWAVECVRNLTNQKPVLILGNGLTMVDTVLGLLEQGFAGDIYSISPHGFNILPHRHSGHQYFKFTEELTDDISLHDLVKLVFKHIKAVRQFGITAEPVIDSLRPYTQKIWKNLSPAERKLFLNKFRHLWGVARHRIPLHIHDKIQQMRFDDKLRIISGKVINIIEENDSIQVAFFYRRNNEIKHMEVSRVINCTGPETNLMNLNHNFLKKCLLNGILTQDELKLGIKTNTNTFQIYNAQGLPHSNLFTLGPNLKGELWESTAVNELRQQAEKLADVLIG